VDLDLNQRHSFLESENEESRQALAINWDNMETSTNVTDVAP
jgi:hypothetical protein